MLSAELVVASPRVNAPEAHCLQSVEAVFQPHAFLRLCSETGSTLEITIWIRLAFGKIFAGEHAVKIGLELVDDAYTPAPSSVNCCSSPQRTSHHAPLHLSESFESGNVRKRHIQLELIEPGCYLSLFRLAIGVSINMSECGIIREVLVADLNQGLSLDAKRKVASPDDTPCLSFPRTRNTGFRYRNHAV